MEERLKNPAVQTHITMLQGIIDRMGKNSSHCKQWCLAVESIFFGIAKDNMSWWFFAFIVVTTLLFWFQDAGYLAFSRHFRNQQKTFVENLHKDIDYEKDIYLVHTLKGCERCCAIIEAASSIFVWPTYIGIIAFMTIFMLN
ncbi:MAG: hypothetical protein IJ693_09915 [Bacteroidaceae bacterium]|nr:hypothetical protein [Bacteroidaceae bacterium]